MWGLAAILWLAGGGALAASERPAPDPKAGQAAYGRSCARCHGAAGKGDGVDAKRFYPRPRDLTLGVYKFRSTASGTPPTDEDLFQTIHRGLPGTNMPDWQQLDEATRWRLVDYLKSLSPVFEHTPPSPVTMPPDPGAKRADLEKGQAVYQQLGCAACHGASGRANGMSAAGLVDDWGMPIRPADFTQGWTFRGGAAPRDIALRLITGIDGAGMPSYAEAVSGEDIWHLAYYVASLQEPPAWHMIAHPLRVSGSLPASLDDPRWGQAERTDLRLRNVVQPAGEWAHPPTVRAIRMQAVYNEDTIAFRLTWDDPTQEAAESPAPDALALVLKPADTQGDVVTLQAWPYAGAPRLDLCYWSAAGVSGETLAAEFDGVRSAPRWPATRTAASSYDDGRWQVLLQRPLQPQAPEGAAAITAGAFTSIAFAVWDGGNADARAVSPWVELSLRDPTRPSGGH
ncbi:MAG: c-type cytochrome [Candidatus Omnitrophica bacterium]|nr:c-type cytochrome [Candidatus Omnitrophota bacterium]